MRILLFVPNYLPGTRGGGPVRSVQGLAQAMVKLGHEVHVLTTDRDGYERMDVPLDRPAELDGVLVHYRPIRFPKRLYYSPDLARLADALVPQMDAVHVNGMFLWPGAYVSRAARRSGTRLVISPRGMLMPNLVNGKSRLAKLAWIVLQERANLAGASAIHVTAKSETECLRAMGLALAPIVQLSNGVALPAELPDDAMIEAVWGDVQPGRRVAYLGRLGWNKGIDLAIAAVRAHPQAVIKLAGHDEIGLQGLLEPQLRRPDGRSCGAFLGHLEGDTKWAFLAGADVVMMPTLQENFGNTLVEAMAVGTPVIATDGVGASHYMRRIDPALVVPREQARLDQALAEILGDSDRRAHAGAAAQALVQSELQWDSIAEGMCAVYRGERR